MNKDCNKRNVVEEAMAELRCHMEEISKHLPCKVTVHLPPPEGSDRVVLEINAKLRS